MILISKCETKRRHSEVYGLYTFKYKFVIIYLCRLFMQIVENISTIPISDGYGKSAICSEK